MDDASLIVRRADPSEFAACAELYVKVLRETFTWLPKDRHKKEDFFRAARDEEIWVAVEAGRIVGLAGFYRPQNFIHSLYVEPRGRGVGKALLDRLTANAQGPISLKVQAPNLRAQAFYAREGFTIAEHGQDPGSEVAWIRLVRSQPKVNLA